MACFSVQAQPIPQHPAFTFEQDFTYAAPTGIDNAGDAELDSWTSSTQIGYRSPVGSSSNLAASVSYAISSFSWEETTAPWDELENISAGLRLTTRFEGNWSTLAFASASFSRATGETFSDGSFGDGFRVTTGLIANYRFSQKFSLGAGLLYLQRLEEDDLFVPIISFNWQPTARLRIFSFDGLYVEYLLTDDRSQSLKFGLSYLGGSYHVARFQGSDDLAIEQNGWRIELAYTTQLGSNLTLTPYIGAVLAQDYEFNAAGTTLAKLELDNQIIGGIRINANF